MDGLALPAGGSGKKKNAPTCQKVETQVNQKNVCIPVFISMVVTYFVV